MSAHLVLNLNQVSRLDLKPTTDISSSSPPPIELKSSRSRNCYRPLGNIRRKFGGNCLVFQA
ncbi:hypothetical protein CR513_57930, partial [Mucuna pruriens]